MCDRMLQDSLRCYRGPGRGVGIQGPGAGCGGDSGPARGVVGIRAQGAGWGFGPGAGRGGDSGPGRGVEWRFVTRARGGNYLG